MSGTIHLIVESDKDIMVMKAILEARNIFVKIRPLPPIDKLGGISRMAKSLSQNIKTARKSRKQNDCIVVLHDADELTTPDNRGDYNSIQAICKEYKEVIHMVAHDELESWILSNKGICDWLGITQKNCDNVRLPSDKLNSLVRAKTGRDFTGLTREKVLTHLSGDTKSPSLQKALSHLENAPCLRD